MYQKKRCFFTLLLVLAVHANADTLTKDICTQLAGHWQGTYTYKDNAYCTLTHNCTLTVKADAIYQGENTYEVRAMTETGAGAYFHATCENGVITSTIFYGNSTVSCDSLNHCNLVYDDERVTCQLSK